jgi:hypothetical protein
MERVYALIVAKSNHLRSHVALGESSKLSAYLRGERNDPTAPILSNPKTTQHNENKANRHCRLVCLNPLHLEQSQRKLGQKPGLFQEIRNCNQETTLAITRFDARLYMHTNSYTVESKDFIEVVPGGGRGVNGQRSASPSAASPVQARQTCLAPVPRSLAEAHAPSRPRRTHTGADSSGSPCRSCPAKPYGPQP